VDGADCPGCGGRLYRSRSRTFTEKLIKLLTRYRTYRCRQCEWRGWVEARQPASSIVRRQRMARTAVGFLLFAAIIVGAVMIAGNS
jgi:hypothetical protein